MSIYYFQTLVVTNLLMSHWICLPWKLHINGMVCCIACLSGFFHLALFVGGNPCYSKYQSVLHSFDGWIIIIQKTVYICCVAILVYKFLFESSVLFWVCKSSNVSSELNLCLTFEELFLSTVGLSSYISTSNGRGSQSLCILINTCRFIYVYECLPAFAAVLRGQRGHWVHHIELWVAVRCRVGTGNRI